MHFSWFSFCSLWTYFGSHQGDFTHQLLVERIPLGRNVSYITQIPPKFAFTCWASNLDSSQSSRHGYIWAIIPLGTLRLLCKTISTPDRCFKKRKNKSAVTAVRTTEAESPCYISLPRIAEEGALQSPRKGLCAAFMRSSRGWQDWLCTVTRLPLLWRRILFPRLKKKLNFMIKWEMSRWGSIARFSFKSSQNNFELKPLWENSESRSSTSQLSNPVAIRCQDVIGILPGEKVFLIWALSVCYWTDVMKISWNACN